MSRPAPNARQIAVVTSTRADYGLLYWILKGIEQAPDLALQLVVTGSHLSAAHGETISEIAKDGFRPAAQVDMQLAGDDARSISHALGRAVSGFADAWQALRPDLVLVLGDRYELVAAVSTAVLARIPVAHLHGGEVTEGAIDDGFRHAVSKMSHLHFASAEAYRQRLLQMGEAPDRVFTVGAPGVEAIRRVVATPRADLERDLGLRLGHPLLLVTLHPETATPGATERNTTALLEALDTLKDCSVVMTGANADPEGLRLNQALTAWVERNRARATFVASLGRQRYVSLASLADAVVGNSSSGIIEIPALRRPTVNIGRRQEGRLRAKSVIDVLANAEEIVHAIGLALSPEFELRLASTYLPYGDGAVSASIVEHIRNADLKRLFEKRFIDLEIART